MSLDARERARERAADGIALREEVRCLPPRIPGSLARKLTPARTHGKVATYNVGCRCDLCRAAGTARKRIVRERKKWQQPSPEDCLTRAVIPVDGGRTIHPENTRSSYSNPQAGDGSVRA